jgi:hypothetical protein
MALAGVPLRAQTIAQVNELRPYGFSATPSITYSENIVLSVGTTDDAVSMFNGTVQFRRTRAPAYEAQRRELIAWFDEEILRSLVTPPPGYTGTWPPADETTAFLLQFPYITLHLYPDLTSEEVLGAAGLPLQYVTYSALSPRSVFEALMPVLDRYVAITTSPPTPRKRHISNLPAAWDEPKRKLFAFFWFWVLNEPLPVALGQALGRGTTLTGGTTALELKVVHEDGPIDPAFALNHLISLYDAAESQRWTELKARLAAASAIFVPGASVDRYAFDASAVDPTASSFRQHAVPYPVLLRIRRDKALSTSTWSQLVRDQVDVYRVRLADLAALRQYQIGSGAGRPGASATEEQLLTHQATAGAANPSLRPFEFNNDDWRNLPQLEAVVDWYINYQEPLRLGVTPRGTGTGYVSKNLRERVTLPTPPRTFVKPNPGATCSTFQSDLFLVQIDDFRLIGGELPLQKVRGIDKDGAWQAADDYRGMMFVVKKGRIEAKERFTSYTSRANSGAQKRSSIKGNEEYGILSKISGGKEGINYSFQVVDVATFDPDVLLPGRRYFDPTAAAGVRVPPNNGKGLIMIHLGYRKNSGSEGCQVSPEYYELRMSLLAAVLGDPIELSRIRTCIRTECESDLRAVQQFGGRLSKAYFNALKKHEQLGGFDFSLEPYGIVNDPIMECTIDSVVIHEDALRKVVDQAYVERQEWNGVIFGKYFLIRPTERHLGWGASP